MAEEKSRFVVVFSRSECEKFWVYVELNAEVKHEVKRHWFARPEDNYNMRITRRQ